MKDFSASFSDYHDEHSFHNQTYHAYEYNSRVIGIIGTVMGILFMCVSALGLIGNISVLDIIFRITKMKTIIDIHVVSLSISNIMFMISAIFFGIPSFMEYIWVFGEAMCHIVFIINDTHQFCVIFSLTVMAIDRYVVICHREIAVRYRSMTLAKFVTMCVWLASIAAASPFIYVTSYNKKQKACGADFNAKYSLEYVELVQKMYVLYAAILGFVLPFLIITFCYSSVARKLRVANARLGTLTCSRKLNRLVRFFILTFFICNCPFFVARLLLAFVPSFASWTYSLIVADLTMLLSNANSLINPILYGLFGAHIKTTLREWYSSHLKSHVSDTAQEMGALPHQVCQAGQALSPRHVRHVHFDLEVDSL
ncbi:somatostatin receptor type 5-like [Amphiura filiformis]|uniref:somatostatin receptor type 5-like n=1 Tax=Amphiura filiformis TaxID=82378 RepID=UPI003B21D2BD